MLTLITVLVCTALGLWAYAARQYYQSVAYHEALMQTLTPSKPEDSPKGKQLPKWLLDLARQGAASGSRMRFGIPVDMTDRLLNQAGRPYGLSTPDFLGLKVVVALGGLSLATVSLFLGVPALMALPVGVACFFGPDLWLKSRASARQDEIARTLPDFLDVLSSCLAAGLPLDTALRQVAVRLQGPLSDEIARFGQEIDLGLPRHQAYDNLRSRNDCRELDLLVQSLMQGQDLGVPVAETLAIQAQHLRSMRVQRAKEKAGKASPKITLVTTFLVTPTVVLFIIAMLVLNFLYNPTWNSFKRTF